MENVIWGSLCNYCHPGPRRVWEVGSEPQFLTPLRRLRWLPWRPVACSRRLDFVHRHRKRWTLNLIYTVKSSSSGRDLEQRSRRDNTTILHDIASRIFLIKSESQVYSKNTWNMWEHWIIFIKYSYKIWIWGRNRSRFDDMGWNFVQMNVRAMIKPFRPVLTQFRPIQI